MIRPGNRRTRLHLPALHLAAEHAVTRVLAEAVGFDEAAPRILENLCSAFQWDLGGVWQVDPDQEVLGCLRVWWSSPDLEPLAAAWLEHRLPPGASLPGRVWATRAPAWTGNLAAEPGPGAIRGVHGLAASLGVRQALAFPILIEDEPWGVLAFGARGREEPDESLLTTLAAVVSGIGQFLKRTRAEAALRESEERLRLALEAGKMGSWEWNLLSGRFEGSAGLERVHGRESGRFAGSAGTIEEYQRDLHPGDRERVLRALAAAIESRGELHMEYRILRQDGEVRWLETRGELMVDAFGRPMRMLGVCADVTSRKQIEEALRQAVAAREQVLAVVSHDLRNLLSPIQAGAALMEATAPLGADARRQIERIQRSAEQMERLIQDLLDVSRAEAGHLSLQLERLEVGPLLEEVVEAHRALAEQRGLRLEAKVPPDLPAVAGDRGRVLQVFGNLVGNAVKFTPAGGSVLLAAEAPEAANAPAGEVRFSVTDTGPGIPEADLERLFEAFWQSPSHARAGKGGTGLGLSITKRLVEGHGGRLWVESAPGRGSVFWFTLPVWAR